MTVPRLTIMFVVLGLTAACGNRGDDVTLSKIRNTGSGPDEFAVVPGKPLEDPESYSGLPAPNPGGPNRTDQHPKADGVAALGGNPAALNETGVPARDTALVRHAGRGGTRPDIRQALAAEDLEIRRRHGRVYFLNLDPIDDYTKAYERQWLDAHAEQRRLRNRGVTTPTAPPEE